MTEDSTTPPPSSRRRGIMANVKGLGFTLVVLAALWIALRYVLTPLVIPEESLKSPVPTAASNYEDRIKALEEKVAALEHAAPAENTANIAPLEERISALENKAPAESAPAAPAIPAEALDALKADIARIRDDNHVTVRTLLLADQMQSALRSGTPFTDELSQLEVLRPDLKDTLVPLEAIAPSGIATLEQLRAGFAQALSPEPSAANDRGLVENLKSLVKIRKVGKDQKGTDNEAIIARAEAKLNAGDVAAALKETENLSPQVAKNFAQWQERARQYLTAGAALQKIRASLDAKAGE